MWKIFFKYSDGSKCTITGKSEISIEIALRYFVRYGVTASESIFQQYPKKDNREMELLEKIEAIGGKETRNNIEALKNELLKAADKIIQEVKHGSIS